MTAFRLFLGLTSILWSFQSQAELSLSLDKSQYRSQLLQVRLAPDPPGPVVIGPVIPPSPRFFRHSAPWLPFVHFGFKTGTMQVSFDKSSHRPASGFMASGRIHRGPLAFAAFEMDAMTTHPAFNSPDHGDGVWDATMFGFYTSFRFGEIVYIKVKTGWYWRSLGVHGAHQQESGHRHTTVYFPGVNNMDWSSMPAALALGWRVGSHDLIEIEAMYLDEKLSLLSFAYVF